MSSSAVPSGGSIPVPTPRETGLLSRLGVGLFSVFLIYLVVPTIDIPLLGLSLSAPLLFLIFLELFFSGSRKLSFVRYKSWMVLSYLFLFGLLLSLAGNMIILGARFEMETIEVVSLVRYGYWILAFFTTLVIISTSPTPTRFIIIIGSALVVLAALRLYEAVAFGRWGAWTGVQILTQNTYGVQFSTFFPFTLALPFILRGWKGRLSIVAIILTVVAVAGNGSRSSWIAVFAAIILFAVLYAITRRNGVLIISSQLTLIVALIALVALIVPETFLDPITNRFDTFETIGGDKSYAIRQLMIQKGLRLFEENPVFGVGLGRFRVSSVPLEIPQLLSYAGQAHFDNKSSHNSYIALLAETGLAGMVPFVLLHALLFLKGLPAAVRLSQHGEVWALAVFCGYIGMSIHLWSLSGLTSTAPWVIYGLIAGMIEYERGKRESVNAIGVPLPYTISPIQRR